MKKILFPLFFLSLFPISGFSQGQVIIKNISTGVASDESLIPYCEKDDTWTIAMPNSDVFDTAYVVSALGGNWWASAPYARWISIFPGLSGSADGANCQPRENCPAGIYKYRTVFAIDNSVGSSYGFSGVEVVFASLGGDNDIVGINVNGTDFALNLSNSGDFNPLYGDVSVVIPKSYLHIGGIRGNIITVMIMNNELWTGFYARGHILAMF